MMTMYNSGWAISTGSGRKDITSVSSLQGKRIGVSRIGSGSFVMGWVLAEQQGWLSSQSSPKGSSSQPESPFAEWVVCNTFATLRDSVNLKPEAPQTEFFMWEYFTSKRYYDNGEISKVGEIYTPWSSWKIVAATELVDGEKIDARVEDLFLALDKGIKHFNENPEEAVAYISSELDYSAEDAREWLKTVRFPTATKGVDLGVAQKTVDVLIQSGVLEKGKGMQPGVMVAASRE